MCISMKNASEADLAAIATQFAGADAGEAEADTAADTAARGEAAGA